MQTVSVHLARLPRIRFNIVNLNSFQLAPSPKEAINLNSFQMARLPRNRFNNVKLNPFKFARPAAKGPP